MTLQDLAARSISFGMRLRSLQSTSEPDWERMRIAEEDRLVLLRKMHRDSVLWLYGYVAALADKKLIDMGNAEQMHYEILGIRDTLRDKL
ncbi:hypothetical protein [Azotobacter armeniacus]